VFTPHFLGKALDTTLKAAVLQGLWDMMVEEVEDPVVGDGVFMMVSGCSAQSKLL